MDVDVASVEKYVVIYAHEESFLWEVPQSLCQAFPGETAERLLDLAIRATTDLVKNGRVKAVVSSLAKGGIGDAALGPDEAALELAKPETWHYPESVTARCLAIYAGEDGSRLSGRGVVRAP
jgi:hypothetical protein